MIYIDYFYYDKPLPKEYFDNAFKLLPAIRQKKCLSYVRQDDRDRSLIAGLLLLHAWKRLQPDQPFAVQTEKRNRPCAPPQLMVDFNISHSQNLIAVTSCTLKQASNRIGLDVQPINSVPAELDSLILHPDEVCLVDLNTPWFKVRNETLFSSKQMTPAELMSTESRPDARTILWASKEACLKQKGSGLYQNPATLNLSNLFQNPSRPLRTFSSHSRKAIKATVLGTFHTSDMRLSLFQLHNNILACATPKHLAAITWSSYTTLSL